MSKIFIGFRRKINITLNGWFGPIPRPQKWVFIVGCYNSGTTLIHDLLANHPDIGSMPDEGQYYTDQLLLPKSVGLPRLWAIEPDRFYLNENSNQGINIGKLKRQWGAYFDEPMGPILLEKSPTNAARTRWLQRHFENAHFIGIIRNGYAVAEGIRRKADHSLDIGARQWTRSNEIMLDDFEMLEKKILIRYEELTESTHETLQQIFNFLGLNSGDQNIENMTGKNWKIHEQTSPIQNMNQRSLDALNKQDIEVIESVAGQLLKRLGYSFQDS